MDSTSGNNHGGARKGAGRKKIKDKKITKSVVLPPDLIEKITTKYPSESFSSIVERALLQLL